MLTTRLLQRDEWHRLRETGLPLEVWLTLDQASVQIVIVEDDGEIVRCWATMAVRHVEGFWAREDHRKRGGSMRALFVGMRELLKALGSTAVVTQAETQDVADLLQSAGATRLPGDSYILPVDFGPWAKG